jgi:lysophospholipase L1-like esterase
VSPEKEENMRRIITTAVALFVIASITTPALAAEPDGPAHIALGDSVAAGSGANDPDRTGYVPRVNRFLRSVDCIEAPPNACPHLELSDYSVGGATSDDLIAEQLDPAVDEILARNGDADPNNDVVYVTITIGGNDLYQPVLEYCTGDDTSQCFSRVAELLGNYQANLFEILGTLRAVAPDAEIAIMTYYNPLGSCFLADLEPLADVVLGSLNDVIRGVAGIFAVTVVETYGLLDDGDLVGGEDCLHPDDSGHRKIARAFEEAMT